MMSRGNFESLPVEYNSNILHVLEAFYNQSQELKRKELEVSELKAQVKQQMDQVELLGKEWSLKEVCGVFPILLFYLSTIRDD